jgi:hypothetical protein
MMGISSRPAWVFPPHLGLELDEPASGERANDTGHSVAIGGGTPGGVGETEVDCTARIAQRKHFQP